MKRARLACLISGLGLVERGAERMTLDLARHLRPYFEITLFGQGTVDAEIRRLWALSRDRRLLVRSYETLPDTLRNVVHRLHLTPLEVEMLTFSLSALGPLWREEYDAHLLATGVWGARIARILRTFRRVPFIYLGHGGYWGELSNAKQRPDLHIFVNQTVMQQIQGLIPDLRAVFIPNGVDLDRFAPRPSRLSLGLERPIYLSVGALVREKCLDLAVRAVASLPVGSLVLVGRGPEEERLRELGKSLLGEKRFLLTAAPFEEMPEYYNACDVFTLPSHKESFGLVYLEAMACGKPVVTRSDEIRELIVGEAGIFCCCENINEYAAALQEATRGVVKEALRRQAERFDIRKIARQYARAIRGVLEGSSL